MVTYAVTLSDLIEKGGAYAGLAAFFGFAVLSVLAFAQAREIRRLRDWAGRAPERAQELEQRVVAQAESARRVVATPSRRPGEPATAAAKPVAKPVPAAAEPVQAEAAAAPAAEEAPTTAQPVVEPEAKPAAAPAEETAVEHPVVASPEPEAAKEDAESDEEAVPAGATTALAPATPDAAPANGAAKEPPSKLPPRATQGPPVTPRPVPAQPLRATQPPSRRPAPAAAAAEPSNRRTPVVIAAVAAGLILVAIGLVAIFTGGDDKTPAKKSATNQAPATTPGASATAGGGSGGKKPTTASRADTKVAVLNGTTVTGLASKVDTSLTQAGYTESQKPDDYTDQARSASIVFYNGSENRTQAIEIGKLLDVSDRQPIVNAASQLAPGADVVVVVGADQTP